MNQSANGAASVVARLVDLIMSDNLAPGDSLPSVRELAQRWKLGRNVVRDGLLHAQVLGLVQIRPRSGVVVRAVDHGPIIAALSQTLAIGLRQQDPSLVHLWQARAIIEMETAAEAARRRLPEDLQRLDQCLLEMQQARDDRAGFVQADERFHLTIAEIAGNPVMRILLDALLKVLRPHRLYLPPGESTEQTMATHMAIYTVIAEGDSAQASRIMGEHCHRHARLLLHPSTRLPAGRAVSVSSA